MDKITEKQNEYIKILSSYESTKNEDLKDIDNFLKRLSKTNISQLSKREASDLIQILLERPTGYTLPCGKTVMLHKQEVNSYHFLGDIDACLHHCPDPKIGGDINNCEPFMKHQADMDEWDEEPVE